jgi:hypothetical protein
LPLAVTDVANNGGEAIRIDIDGGSMLPMMSWVIDTNERIAC